MPPFFPACLVAISSSSSHQEPISYQEPHCLQGSSSLGGKTQGVCLRAMGADRSRGETMRGSMRRGSGRAKEVILELVS